jgi:hypothetical protein
MRSSWTSPSGVLDTLAPVGFLLLTSWLVWAVFQVNIDFDDGYGNLANAGHFLGQRPEHFFNSAPLMAFLLTPVKLLSDGLGLHPLDLRPAHALMALLHIAYVIACWRLLVRIRGRDLPSLLAFAAAVATPVFFSYAPFINLDIFPGALMLWMVVLAHQQLHSPSPRIFWLLVLLGAALASLKQAFALIWVAIALGLPMLCWIEGAPRQQWLAAFRLWGAAVLSGVLTWLFYGAVLANPFAADPLWIRPWLQIQAISHIYDVEGGGWQVFYPWIYLRNVSAYGILAMLLVLPGLVLAFWRGQSIERLVAMVWLLLLVALHLTPYKEVRYLAFLAPLTAVLIAPVLQQVWQQREIYRWIALIALSAGLLLSVAEALRLANPYYQSAMMDFLEPLPTGQPPSGRLIMGGPLSFVSPESNAYFGDRYHRITHLMPEAIMSLYDYPAERLLRIKQTTDIQAQMVEPGDIWLLTKDLLVRKKPFVRGNHEGLDPSFFQLFAVAEWTTLLRQQGGYRISGPYPQAVFVLVSELDGGAPTLASTQVDDATLARLYGWKEFPPRVQVLAFRILRRCSLSACQRLDRSQQSPETG